MNDELTPELQEAMEKLPRERMPAGLEARVFDAMRDHGFLNKRRRTVAITSGRVAGLVAACVALVIGGYSIGIQRGGGTDMVLPQTTTPGAVTPEAAAPEGLALQDDAAGRSNELATDALEKKEVARDASKAPAKTSPSADQPREIVPASEAMEEPVAAEPQPEGALGSSAASQSRSDEETTKRLQRVEVDKDQLATPIPEAGSSPPREKPAAKTMSAESAYRSRQKMYEAAPEPAKPSLTYMLNGVPVVIEAPDSVRIVQDERGRMLLIYTSDGIIRVRVGDDR